MIYGQHLGRHHQEPQDYSRTLIRRRRARWTAMIATASMVLGIVAVFALHSARHPAPTGRSVPQRHGLPITPDSYIGLYTHGVPNSYAGITAFTKATGIKPRVVVYYSGWQEPFKVAFARTAANDGAVPLVQMNPAGTKIAAIAAGKYDNYLNTYANAVRAYHHQVILSFGHEMNGFWYSWGYTHTSPAVFVAAWRHIVTVFRARGAQNVTWLWTINTIHKKTRVPSPGPWWPGNAYVTWVGIDGYFTNSSLVFASVFGPTIVYVRSMTRKPILITETSATPVASQPAKIADLFAGIRLYSLLGFVWFNSVDKVDWRLSSPAAITAFRQGAEMYHRVAS